MAENKDTGSRPTREVEVRKGRVNLGHTTSEKRPAKPAPPPPLKPKK